MGKVVKFMSRDKRISRFCEQLFSHVSLRIQGLPEETLRRFAHRQHELYVDLKKRGVSLTDIGQSLQDYILWRAGRWLVRENCRYCKLNPTDKCDMRPENVTKQCEQFEFDNAEYDRETEQFKSVVIKLDHCYGLKTAEIVTMLETMLDKQ